MLPVDHGERKLTIAEKATKIIAREGMQAATIRRIAAELNFSTRAVTHYFSEKNELLDWVYEYMATEGYRSFAQRVENDPADLLGCLMTMTPLDSLNRDLWRVYIAFWDLAMRDPHIAAELHKSIEQAEHLVAGIIAVRNPRHGDRVCSARQLIALVNGISVQLLLEPGTWEPDRVKGIFERNIETLLGPPGAQTG